MKCNECGTSLTPDMTECPNCGCPLVSPPPAPTSETTPVSDSIPNAIPKFKKKVTILFPILSLIIGIVILVLGASLVKRKAVIDPYTTHKYSVDSHAFGGDFYTEIYGASVTIVDELNAINNGLSTISASVTPTINAIYYSCGMIIIALGLVVISLSFIAIGKHSN